jgi:hypothetical protein
VTEIINFRLNLGVQIRINAVRSGGAVVPLVFAKGRKEDHWDPAVRTQL